MADRQDADVFEEVQAFNDHGKVLAGVHENFLGVRFNDPTLCKVRPWLYNPRTFATFPPRDLGVRGADLVQRGR